MEEKIVIPEPSGDAKIKENTGVIGQLIKQLSSEKRSREFWRTKPDRLQRSTERTKRTGLVASAARSPVVMRSRNRRSPRSRSPVARQSDTLSRSAVSRSPGQRSEGAKSPRRNSRRGVLPLLPHLSQQLESSPQSTSWLDKVMDDSADSGSMENDLNSEEVADFATNTSLLPLLGLGNANDEQDYDSDEIEDFSSLSNTDSQDLKDLLDAKDSSKEDIYSSDFSPRKSVEQSPFVSPSNSLSDRKEDGAEDDLSFNLYLSESDNDDAVPAADVSEDGDRHQRSLPCASNAETTEKLIDDAVDSIDDVSRGHVSEHQELDDNSSLPKDNSADAEDVDEVDSDLERVLNGLADQSEASAVKSTSDKEEENGDDDNPSEARYRKAVMRRMIDKDHSAKLGQVEKQHADNVQSAFESSILDFYMKENKDKMLKVLDPIGRSEVSSPAEKEDNQSSETVQKVLDAQPQLKKRKKKRCFDMLPKKKDMKPLETHNIYARKSNGKFMSRDALLWHERQRIEKMDQSPKDVVYEGRGYKPLMQKSKHYLMTSQQKKGRPRKYCTNTGCVVGPDHGCVYNMSQRRNKSSHEPCNKPGCSTICICHLAALDRRSVLTSLASSHVDDDAQNILREGDNGQRTTRSATKEDSERHIDAVKRYPYDPDVPVYFERDDEDVKPAPRCGHVHCRFGCVCQSLAAGEPQRSHCASADCMFYCTCGEAWSNPYTRMTRKDLPESPPPEGKEAQLLIVQDDSSSSDDDVTPKTYRPRNKDLDPLQDEDQVCARARIYCPKPRGVKAQRIFCLCQTIHSLGDACDFLSNDARVDLPPVLTSHPALTTWKTKFAATPAETLLPDKLSPAYISIEPKDPALEGDAVTRRFCTEYIFVPKSGRRQEGFQHLLEIRSNCDWSDIKEVLLDVIKRMADVAYPSRGFLRNFPGFTVEIQRQPLRNTKDGGGKKGIDYTRSRPASRKVASKPLRKKFPNMARPKKTVPYSSDTVNVLSDSMKSNVAAEDVREAGVESDNEDCVIVEKAPEEPIDLSRDSDDDVTPAENTTPVAPSGRSIEAVMDRLRAKSAQPSSIKDDANITVHWADGTVSKQPIATLMKMVGAKEGNVKGNRHVIPLKLVRSPNSTDTPVSLPSGAKLSAIPLKTISASEPHVVLPAKATKDGIAVLTSSKSSVVAALDETKATVQLTSPTTQSSFIRPMPTLNKASTSSRPKTSLSGPPALKHIGTSVSTSVKRETLMSLAKWTPMTSLQCDDGDDLCETSGNGRDKLVQSDGTVDPPTESRRRSSRQRSLSAIMRAKLECDVTKTSPKEKRSSKRPVVEQHKAKQLEFRIQREKQESWALPTETLEYNYNSYRELSPPASDSGSCTSRARHITCERQRRKELGLLFDMLKDVLTDSARLRSSKDSILNAAVKKIDELKTEEEYLEKETRSLLRRNEALSSQLEDSSHKKHF